MRVLCTLALVALALVMAAAEERQSYEGFQVFRTATLTKDQANAIGHLPYDFWKRPRAGGSADVMVPPRYREALSELLGEQGIEYTVQVEDVEEFLVAEKQERANRVPSSNRQVDSLISFEEYLRYDDIVQYLFNVSDLQDWANVVEIGTSYEGRTMYALEITKAGDDAVANIYSQAGVHAREWIADAVGLFTIYELVERYSEQPQYVDNFNFYIVPSGNPDGYEYTWDVNRLWRKTRTDNTDQVCPLGTLPTCNEPEDCFGTDMNRNWEYHWAESGASPIACSDTYQGPFPYSEIESENLKEYYLSISPLPELAVCFHSAAQLWLYPYGYANGTYPENVDEMITLADGAVAALNALNGENFEVLNSADLYPAAGAADDYFASIETRFVYTPELREGPASVFVLPEEEIIPSGEEVWEAWKYMLDFLMNE